ncbi:MAG: hypothetical protein IJ215_05140 [Clostridia bacterium]|nr:hypothetical protein [Clostridia bacterium]
MGKPTLNFGVNFDEKVSTLKAAMVRQITVIEADIMLGSIENETKAKRYQNKIRSVLEFEYFTKPVWLRKRVKTLNEQVKADAYAAKVEKERLEDALEDAKNIKLKGVQFSLADLDEKGEISEEKKESLDKRFEFIDAEIAGLEAKLKSQNLLYKDLRFLQGMLNNEKFFNGLYKPG